MAGTQILLSVLLLSGAADSFYKRWVPNTNFENASNWLEQRTPCSRDKVVFEGGKQVSVFVQSLHSLSDLYIPLDGEFILSPNAGFMAAAAEDPGCGEGSVVNFGDANRHQWFDPTLWQTAASTEDLENGRYLFSVDAEHVPCRHDDVIFSPETSFRVHIPQTGSEIKLRSISVFGQTFASNADFGAHAASRTGKLQFPGPARPQIINTKCPERSGCTCGNDEVLPEICSALLQHTGNKCPDVPCAHPLQPHGHCCAICGVVILLEYSPEFDIEAYRSRLIHSFLNLAKYSGVRLAISKVQSSPLATSETKIQIVTVDEKEGAKALELAQDVMADIRNNGQWFGITKAELQEAVSARGGAMPAGPIAGIVLGLILGLAFLGGAYFLYKMEAFQLPFLQVSWFGGNVQRLEEETMTPGGFHNPIYEAAAEPGEGKVESHPESGIQFSNPVFDCDTDV
ncbi:protein amnionless [Gastrophryne carolinensis]